MKILLGVLLVALSTSCTTLENRRDLYRAPGEGYEQWSRRPPPTRLPSTGPTNPTSATPTQRNGVISFPDE